MRFDVPIPAIGRHFGCGGNIAVERLPRWIGFKTVYVCQKCGQSGEHIRQEPYYLEG